MSEPDYSDIVYKLRHSGGIPYRDLRTLPEDVLCEAADEIERLREQLRQQRETATT